MSGEIKAKLEALYCEIKTDQIELIINTLNLYPLDPH